MYSCSTQSVDGVDEMVYESSLIQYLINGSYLHLFYLQIVRNKWSGFDVCKMDYITRDSHNTAMSGSMEWRYYTCLTHFNNIIMTSVKNVFCSKDGTLTMHASLMAIFV